MSFFISTVLWNRRTYSGTLRVCSERVCSERVCSEPGDLEKKLLVEGVIEIRRYRDQCRDVLGR